MTTPDENQWCESLLTVARYLKSEVSHQQAMIHAMERALENKPPESDNFSGWLSNLSVERRRAHEWVYKTMESSEWNKVLEVPENTNLVYELKGEMVVTEQLECLAHIPLGSSLSLEGGSIVVQNLPKKGLFVIDAGFGAGIAGIRIANGEIHMEHSFPVVYVSDTAMAHVVFHCEKFLSGDSDTTFKPIVQHNTSQKESVFITSTPDPFAEKSI